MKNAILMLFMLASVSIGNANPTIHSHTKIVTESVFICVSRTGHKYHTDQSCRGLNRCTHEIRKVTKAQAIKMGYSACKICY